MLSKKKNALCEDYKDIIYNLDIGFFRVGIDGTILNHNPKFNEIFGISPNENLVGTISFDFWQQTEDRNKFISELKNKGYVKNYVTHAKKVTGEKIVVQGNSHLVRDEYGNPIATEGTIVDISEKYILEQQLKTSEEKYRDLIEFSPDIIFEVDLKLNITYVNSIAFDKFGYTKEDVAEGINIIQLIDPEYKAIAYSKIKNVFEGKETQPDTYLLRKKDGTPLYTRIHSRPIIENGSVVGMRGTVTDINERILTEQKLKVSEEKYRLITENSQDIVYTMDINLNNTYISPSVSRVLGYSVDEAILMNSRNNAHIDDLDKIALIFKDEFKLERQNGIEKDLNRKRVFTIREKHKDGRTLTMEHTISWLRDENGIAVGFLGVARDVTESKATEKRLGDSEEKYRLISENANDLITVLDMELNYEYINKSYEFLGYSKEEIYKGKATDIVHPEDIKRAINAFRKGSVKGTGSEELRIKHKDGQYSWFEIKGTLFNDENDELKALLVSRDITERKEFEKQLKESEEKYRSLFENMNAGFAYHEVILNENNQPIDYIYHEVNPAFEMLTGMKKEDLIGKKVTEAIPGTDNDPADWIGKFGNIALTGIPLTVEDYSEAIDRWFKVSGYSPKKGFFAVTFSDITEVKKAEESLRESELKFSTISEQSLLGIAILQDDKFKYINQRFADISGWTVEEVSKWGAREYLTSVHPEDQDIVIDHAKKRQLGYNTKATGYECRTFKKNGEIMWVQTYSKTIPFNGKFADLITTIDITDRKIAEQNLKKSEEQYRSFIDNISDMIMEVDLNNKITYVSPQIKEMLGYSENEAIGLRISKLIHPDDLPHILKGMQETLNSSDVLSTEYRLQHKDGYYIYVFAKGSLVKIGDNIKFIGVIRDITKRKRAEEKLKESELKFRTIAEQTLMGICIIQDFEVKYLNQQMADIYGYPIDEVNNWKPREFIKVIHPDSRDMAISQITRKQRGDTDVTIHYIAKIITKNGTIKWVENYSTPILYQGKSADLLTQIDSTSKMEAENKIRISEEKYHHLYESSPYAIILVNTRGEILDCNLTSENLSGFSKEDIVGKSFQNLSFIPKEYIPFAIEDFKSLLRGKAIEPKEIQLYAKQGDLKWVSYHASIFYIEKETVFQIIIQDITDRRRAENKLIESEEKYHNLFETSPNGVILADLNGTIIECNSAVEDISGYSPKEFIGKTFMNLELYKENGLEVLLEGFQDLLGNKSLEYIEFPINHKDERTIWIRINSRIISMKGEDFILAVIYAITTQKTAEEALKRSEEQYRDLLETSSVGVVELDIINKNLTYINPKLLDIIGYKRDDLNEEIFLNKLIHQKDLTKILRSMEESELEFRIFDKQGKLKWLAGKRIPYFNENNEVIGMRIWLDDITEKKMYEELIYELNINFLNFTTDIRNNIELLLNTGLKLLNGDLILYAHKVDSQEDEKYQIITSGNETYTFESKEFKESLIVSDLLIEGHDFPQTFFDIDENKFADSDPFIRDIKAKGCFGKVIKSQDGLENLVCVFYKDNPVISGQDKLVLFLICDAIEIEQRRWRVQEDLEKQNITLDKINKLKTELFSRTSHELKTPLISIKGFTELLLTLHKSKLDTETISILEEIKDGGKRLEKIINLLLESTKLEAGQLELNLAQEDLTFLINFCVKELKGLARLRNQTIIFDAENKIEAIFDKERIYEVLSNLLLNAVKYTPPGGTISIQTQSDDHSYIISVKDNGIGFTEDEKSQVFKQFGKIERYGQGWDVAIEGTGLGLYITKKLVDLHDGKIWLESEGRNKGTTFFFSIPKL